MGLPLSWSVGWIPASLLATETKPTLPLSRKRLRGRSLRSPSQKPRGGSLPTKLHTVVIEDWCGLCRPVWCHPEPAEVTPTTPAETKTAREDTVGSSLTKLIGAQSCHHQQPRGCLLAVVASQRLSLLSVGSFSWAWPTVTTHDVLGTCTTQESVARQ